MIVKSIAVSNWRNILGRLKIGEFTDELNVVYAPNGSGKSSLFEAFRRCLMDRHNVTGGDIIGIQPWGRGLTPEVTVEFSQNGQFYRITKNFIQKPSSFLEKYENGKYESVADGRSADDRLKELLTINPPLKGLSKPEHWGWAQALWVPQGGLAIESLSNDVRDDIRGVLNAQLAAGQLSGVEQTIQQLYEQYYTSGGKTKKGKNAPRIVHLQEKFRAAEIQLITAKESYQSFQKASEEVEYFRSESLKMQQELDKIKTSLTSTQNDVKKYNDLKHDKNSCEKDVKIQMQMHSELNAVIKGIAKEEAALIRERNQLESLNELIKADKDNFKIAEQEFDSCQQELEKIKQIEAHVNKRMAEADAARSFSDISSKFYDLTEKLSKISVSNKKLLELKSLRDTVKAPDDKTFKVISRAFTDRESVNLKIEASLMNIEILAETGFTMEVTEGDTPGSFRMDPGSTNVLKGSPRVSLRIPDVATIRAWGPTGSIEDLRRKLEETEKTILSLTEPYGSCNLAELEELRERAREIDQSIDAEKRTVEVLLGKEKIAELEERKKTLDQQLQEILELHPEWRTDQPDWKNLKLEAEKVSQSVQTQKAGASAKLDTARENRDELNKKIGINEARVEAAETTIRQIEGRLKNLQEDNRTPEQRREELREIAIKWDAAKGKLQKAEERFKEFPDDPQEILDRLNADHTRIDSQLKKCKEDENIAIGKLNHLSESGSYTALTEAEENVSQLERDIRHQQLEMDSIKLLHETIETVRQDALASVSKPVEDAATQTLNFICGTHLGRICLGTGFEPSQITPDSCDFNVGLSNLSGGEREQLHFAVRLALANVLAQKERQLVVLDDVLTATDSVRIGRVLDVLEDNSKKLQVIVLTCHPERYEPLSSARFFDFNQGKSPR
ncbi:MAG: AAA family ATPase [Desulfomonilaceae bacterium]